MLLILETILNKIFFNRGTRNSRNYKPKGRSPFYSEIIRYALLLRYTSLQSYKLPLEKSPLPSISLQNISQQGGGGAFNSIVELIWKVIYTKAVVAFMKQGLKKPISFVIKALPEIKITGRWFASHISEYISCLSKAEFNVRAVVTYNHSSNVNTFNCLLYTYGTIVSK